MTLISATLRTAVEQRAGLRCEYCQLSQEYQVATFPIDHVLPVSEGGETVSENLCLACPRCNAGKWTHTSGSDPATGEVVPLFNPRTQAWSEHFRWCTDDPKLIEPLTPAGRATIALLEMNGTRHVQVRRWLAELQLHPPEENPRR